MHSDSLQSADDNELNRDDLKTLIIKKYHHNVYNRALLDWQKKQGNTYNITSTCKQSTMNKVINVGG